MSVRTCFSPPWSGLLEFPDNQKIKKDERHAPATKINLMSKPSIWLRGIKLRGDINKKGMKTQTDKMADFTFI